MERNLTQAFLTILLDIEIYVLVLQTTVKYTQQTIRRWFYLIGRFFWDSLYNCTIVPNFCF